MSGYTASNLSMGAGNSGTWTTGGNDGVWEGRAWTVPFNVNGQARFTTINVTLAGVDGEFLHGDVNHDGRLTIADVTELIDYLLTDTETAPVEADVNWDGTVTIKDVTDLIDLLLTRQ